MSLNNLYKNIIDTALPGADSNNLLQQLVKDYPYYSLAHFFLLQQTDVANEDYNQIAAKTALHFSNPFLLQQHLRKTTLPIEVEKIYEIFPQINYEEESFENTGTEQVEIIEPVNSAELITEYVAPVWKEEVSTDNSQSPSSFSETEETAYIEPANSAELVPEYTAPIFTEEITSSVEETETVITEEISTTYQEESINFQETEQAEIIETLNSTVLIPEDAAPILNEEIAAPEEEKQNEIKEEQLVFEPLFASDYFASQGIKLRDEVLPTDKLGKQLKSFTDWLKTMKKVHEAKLPAGSEAMDLSVQSLAEKSNQEEDVLTETMAEVFLQQGKLNKAKEIYEKLSLLNPSKIAYFAAKIEQIK